MPSRLEYQRYHVFQATRWPQDISKRQCSLSLGRFSIGFWLATISKISAFEAPKFFQSFSLLGSVLPAGLGRGAAAPEATHRCTTQPWRATKWSSSGSSRPRRPWMRRTATAVASDEDLLGKTSWGNGIFTWGSGWNVDGSSSFDTSLFVVSVLPKTCGTDILYCSLWSRLYCADTSSWTLFESMLSLWK